MEGDESLRLSLRLHRNSKDSLARSLGDGQSCIVLRYPSSSKSDNPSLTPGQSLQGGLFQITRTFQPSKEHVLASETPTRESLQVIFDCAVIVDIQATTLDGHTQEITVPSEERLLSARKLASPWHLDICAGKYPITSVINF